LVLTVDRIVFYLMYRGRKKEKKLFLYTNAYCDLTLVIWDNTNVDDTIITTTAIVHMVIRNFVN